MENHEQLARLTEREKVCLRQWLQHKSAKEIAADLHISHHAVEKRLKMARMKLGATSSLEAARLLGEAEGYGQTVAQPPDLPPHALPPQTVFTRPLILGAIAMIIIAAAVLALFLHPTGERSATSEAVLLAREYDEQLDLVLTAIIASAVIGPDGEVILSYSLGDRRYLQPNSGHYWQISAAGYEDFPSRSLWARKFEASGRKALSEPFYYDSTQFPNEPLRVAERTVSLPNSDVEWQFVVARSRASLD